MGVHAAEGEGLPGGAHIAGYFGSIRQRRGGGLFGLVRRLVVLAFAVIQLILVARILVDFGVLPADGTFGEVVIGLSEALAAPVQEIGKALGGFGGFGGVGLPGAGGLGRGLDPTIVLALAGWTIVEWLVLRVVGKFASA